MLVFSDAEYRRLSFAIEAPIRQKILEKRAARERAVTKTVVCKHWLRGLCKKADNCEFLHVYDLSKMPPCHFYTNFQACNNPECPFLHLEPETLIKDCPWYKRGFCRHGPNCKNRHVRGEPCFNYLAGFCPLGESCKFGHPRFERPTEERWIAPPICTKCACVGHRAMQCQNRPAVAAPEAPMPFPGGFQFPAGAVLPGSIPPPPPPPALAAQLSQMAAAAVREENAG